jgi:hypothetical protein
MGGDPASFDPNFVGTIDLRGVTRTGNGSCAKARVTLLGVGSHIRQSVEGSAEGTGGGPLGWGSPP